MPPGVQFAKAPKGEGEVFSGTIPTVKINGKEAAVLGSKVKTCSDPMPMENCQIIAIGVSPKLPIEIPVTNPIDRSITSPKWSLAKAGVGEIVKLSVQLKNQYENATVDFKIFPEGADVQKEQPVEKLYGRNIGGKAEAECEFKLPDDYKIENPDENEIAPADEIAGIQYRLNKLGHNCGEITGVRDQQTKDAVKSFQKANGLKVDGIPGEKTQKKLEEMYKKQTEKEKKEQKELKYIFTAESFGCKQIKSGAISLTPAYFEIKLSDESKNPYEDEIYQIKLTDGSVVKGKVNTEGYAKVFVKNGKNCKLLLSNLDGEIWKLK